MPDRRIMSGKADNRGRRRRRKKPSIWFKLLVFLVRGFKFKTKVKVTGFIFVICFAAIIAAVISKTADL